MPSAPDASSRDEPMNGSLYVVAQFGLLALIVWLARGGAYGALPLALIVAGAATGIAAIAANRPGNFNIRPVPKAGGTLVTAGPYRWIRHPMYTALLVGSLGLLLAAPGAAIGLAWLALAVVLTLKARTEERGMLITHPDYANYMRRTKRFIPAVF